VLFNELAFFKLMQDLDSNSITVKQRCKRKIEAAGVIQSYAKEVSNINFDFSNNYKYSL
jgi:pericentriolar material 1 protein